MISAYCAGICTVMLFVSLPVVRDVNTDWPWWWWASLLAVNVYFAVRAKWLVDVR